MKKPFRAFSFLLYILCVGFVSLFRLFCSLLVYGCPIPFIHLGEQIGESFCNLLLIGAMLGQNTRPSHFDFNGTQKQSPGGRQYHPILSPFDSCKNLERNGFFSKERKQFFLTDLDVHCRSF